MVALTICALALAAAVGLPIYSAVKKSRTASASTTSTTSTGTTTPVSPAPAAVTKKYGWVLWIVVILAAIIAYHFIAPALKTSAPAPQKATAPKKEWRKSSKELPLEYFPGHGEKIVLTEKSVWIYKGGFAIYRQEFPRMVNGRFRAVFSVIPKDPDSRFRLQINGKGNFAPPTQKFNPGQPVLLEFSGDATYFQPGENHFSFSSGWDEAEVQSARVSVEYWE